MQIEALKFSSLLIEGWRQFGYVHIELHPRLTVITGANGAGKSTILRIFAQHFGFEKSYLATPFLKNSGEYTYESGVFSKILHDLWSLFFSNNRKFVEDGHATVGSIAYSNNFQSDIFVPVTTTAEYQLGIGGKQDVKGLHIDSHQTFARFQQVTQIPAQFNSIRAVYNSYNGEVISRYLDKLPSSSPLMRMKEAIIAMAMFGEGNSGVEGNRIVLDAYKAFVEKLRIILPENIGFIDIAIRSPEIVLLTRSGDFLIDAASGGLMALIDLTWRIHLFSVHNSEFVVTFDEPENHLHPTIQRSLMRRLLEAFPKVQFIVATHSPFMVSSVKESNVYALRYVSNSTGKLQSDQIMPSEASRVRSECLDTIDKAGTASEILREVLGVSVTSPEWVEEKINQIVESYREKKIDAEMLDALRRDLASIGYEESYFGVLADLANAR